MGRITVTTLQSNENHIEPIEERISILRILDPHRVMQSVFTKKQTVYLGYCDMSTLTLEIIRKGANK